MADGRSPSDAPPHDPHPLHTADALARRAQDIFMHALDKPVSQRENFIAENCAGDEALQREVESLLASSDRAGSFLETPARVLASPPEDGDEGYRRTEACGDRMIGQKVGDFTILDVIGSGGMGDVFLAEQKHPARTVALKVMRPGLMSRRAWRRFEDESRILARLQHPNIAQVFAAGNYDDGTAPGRVPYFAMEYIRDAQPITCFAMEKSLSPHDRLRMVLDVCDAVHHGHQKGVIHRDLKPANILVAQVSDQSVPAQRVGVLKVIDFGVARCADSDLAVTTMQTDVGQIIGTLQYMSPEQCEADPHNIDIRSDVYALGVILYELLCDRVPYDVSSSAMHEAARLICEHPPHKPSTIVHTLRGDLETIILKALEKERDRRYQSAADMARDIQHYLNCEPIDARPASRLYKARMFTRRNRALVAIGAAAALTLVVGVVVSTIFGIGQAQARFQADLDKNTAQQQADIANAVVEFLNNDMLGLADPYTSSDRDLTVGEALDAASTRIRDQFSNQPHVESSIRSTLGVTYLNLGKYDQAEEHLVGALELDRTTLGDLDKRTLSSIYGLGRLRFHQLRYNEADSLLTQAVDGRSAVLGAEHPDTLKSMSILATLRLRQGRTDEAETMHRELLELRRRVLGDSHPDILESLDRLALVYTTQGRFADALELYEEAYESSQHVWGTGSRYLLYFMGNLARVNVKLGRHAEAEPRLIESLALAERILGEDHPDTLVYMGDLGTLYTNTGRYAEAEEYCVNALERSRRVHGDAHINTITCQGNLARLRRLQRNFDEAESLYLQAVEQATTIMGEEHSTTLTLLDSLALVYSSQGRVDEAISIHEDALKAKQRTLGEDHPNALSSANNLALAYGRQGRVAEAEMLFRELVETRRRLLGDEHPQVALSLTNLGSIVMKQKRYEEAQSILGEAIDVWRAQRGDLHPYTANALGSRAYALLRLEKPAEAVPLFRESIEIQLAAESKNSTDIGETMIQLGGALTTLQRYDEAEEVLLEGFETFRGDTVGRRRGAIEYIARMYDAWGKPDLATEWRARLPDQPQQGTESNR